MVYDLLPILIEELAAFRRGAEAREAWVEDRKRLRDESLLHERWCSVLD
jgi:hypothetical protein